MQKLIAIFLLGLFNYSIFSQNSNEAIEVAIEEYQYSNCLPEKERDEIEKITNDNVRKLIASSKLSSATLNVNIAFDWPLRAASNFPWNSYYAMAQYVDHNSSTGLLDYNCNAKTYNGHRGTDIFLWPFKWYMVENNLVEVIVAESGTIVFKRDGNYDKNCSWSGQSNTIVIQHLDGSKATYSHLKKNTLTAKEIGETVQKGEYLGIVASSGRSTGPHLHFEVVNSLGELIDPFAGSCNDLNNNSWWASQRPYRKPTLNALLTHYAVPTTGCYTSESPKFSNTFNRRQTAYFVLYFADLLRGDIVNVKIKRPDNSIWYSNTHTSSGTYSSRFIYWYRTLPSDSPYGIWKWEATYKGEIFTHLFEVVDPNNTCPINKIVLDSPSNGEIIKASNSITTQGLIGVSPNYNVEFKAGTSISLNNGFHAKAGSNFYAYIATCTLSNIVSEEPIVESRNSGMIEEAVQFQVVSNPLQSQADIRFYLPTASTAKVLIFDLNGQLLTEQITESAQGWNNTQLDASELAAGMYYITLQTQEGRWTEKVMVIR